MIQKTNLIFIIPFLFLFSCCLDSEKDLLKDATVETCSICGGNKNNITDCEDNNNDNSSDNNNENNGNNTSNGGTSTGCGCCDNCETPNIDSGTTDDDDNTSSNNPLDDNFVPPAEPLPLSKDFVFVKGATIEGAIQAEGYPQSDCFKAGAKYEIKDFYISNHELTQSEFAKYYPGYEYRINENEYSIGPDYPAYDLSWFDALIYCNYRSMAEGRTPCYTINDSTNPKDWGKVPKDASWGNLDVWLKAKCDFNANGYRLPKYVEWEYAARGGNGLTGYQYKYAGSDNIDEVAVWKVKELAKVKTKKSNGLGLYDMTGNVEEWCWDRVGNDLNRACPSCNYYLVEEWSFELAKAIRSNMRDVTSRGTQIGLRLVCTAD